MLPYGQIRSGSRIIVTNDACHDGWRDRGACGACWRCCCVFPGRRDARVDTVSREHGRRTVAAAGPTAGTMGEIMAVSGKKAVAPRTATPWAGFDGLREQYE